MPSAISTSTFFHSPILLELACLDGLRFAMNLSPDLAARPLSSALRRARRAVPVGDKAYSITSQHAPTNLPGRRVGGADSAQERGREFGAQVLAKS
jgi:hypothetical protein